MFNIKATFVLLSAVLLAAILAVSGRVLVDGYHQSEVQRQEMGIRWAEQALSRSLPGLAGRNGMEALRTALRLACEPEGNLGSEVRDARGIPLAAFHKRGAPAGEPRNLVFALPEGTPPFQATLWVDDRLVPDSARRMWRLYLTSVALALTVLMLLNTWFIGHLALYLRHLLSAFRRVDEGDLSVRLRVHSTAEFRKLQQYFNHMLKGLEETRDKLQSFAGEASRKNLQLQQEVEVRRLAEEATRLSERKFHAVFDESYEAVLLLGPDGRVRELNQTALAHLAATAGKVIGSLSWEPALWHGDAALAQRFRAAFEEATAGRLARLEAALPAPADGEPCTLEMVLKAVRASDGSLEMVICEGHDITERVKAQKLLKETEAQVRQAQKMDAVGRLAGGIAHDFNNLLTSILGFGQLVLEGLGEKHPGRKDMLEVIASAERAKDLTQKLLTFSRKQAERSDAINLNQVLRNAEKLIRVSLHEDIEYVPDFDDSIGLIEIDTTSMEQIIVNLAVNARDAMPRSGRLYATTRRVRLDQAFCAKWPALAPGWHVRLSVRDTGYGMGEEVLSRIFEPFFTTKEPGEGTGLGLSTVYGIVQQHKGLILCHSQPGEGTEFELFFPESASLEGHGPAQPAAVPKQAGPLPTGSETILLVEDEDKVRDLAVKLIRSLGYQVITATDGENGLATFMKHKGEIDLIVSDVVMPLMSGPEMVSKIKAASRNLRYLFVSGFTRDQLAKHLAGDRAAVVLQKPYSREELAYRIREQLDQHRAKKSPPPKGGGTEAAPAKA